MPNDKNKQRFSLNIDCMLVDGIKEPQNAEIVAAVIYVYLTKRKQGAKLEEEPKMKKKNISYS